jgi:3-deoxy-D-manno-octulosonic-acid transferase
MLFLYRALINLIYLLSPIIIIIRLLKKKEHLTRFKEKIGFFSNKKSNGQLIWFHGASVGEIQSVVPLIEKLEKNKNIKQVLITSNTLSSSKIIKDLKLKKIIHQFFPIDTNFISNKFINYWKPSKAFFIDSEIWPNMILNLKKKKIPLTLINGRITKKTFQKWKFISGLSNNIFSKFNLCLASSKESLKLLKELNVNNVKFIGNLKFSQSEKKMPKNSELKKKFSNKKIWCASSTHSNEELICGSIHLNLKKKIKNLLTIIIPRHIERSKKIKKDLEKLSLKVHIEGSKKKLESDTDIYLVNSYGKTKAFFENTNIVFLGGSLINHGGQNPLEAARFGCNIICGPFNQNFKEIYEFLEKNSISKKIHTKNSLSKYLNILLHKENKNNKIKHKLKIIGQNILTKTIKEINF